MKRKFLNLLPYFLIFVFAFSSFPLATSGSVIDNFGYTENTGSGIESSVPIIAGGLIGPRQQSYSLGSPEGKMITALYKCAEDDSLITESIVGGTIQTLIKAGYFTLSAAKKIDFLHKKMPGNVTDAKSVGIKRAYLCVADASGIEDGLTPAGRISRARVKKSLYEYAHNFHLPLWKIKEVVNLLDTSGFFNMNAADKKKYLSKNVASLEALKIVARAEGIHLTAADDLRENIKHYLYKYATSHYLPEDKIKSTLLALDKSDYFSKPKQQRRAYIMARVGGMPEMKIVGEAENFEIADVPRTGNISTVNKAEEMLKVFEKNKAFWIKTFNHIFYIEKDGQIVLNEKILASNDGSATLVFITKRLWNKDDINTLYSEIWPDLKSNKGSEFFDCVEQNRLRDIWQAGAFDEISKSFPNLGGVKDIGITGDSPMDDILMLVPVERLVSIIGKSTLAVAKASKFKPIAAGSEVLEVKAMNAVNAGQGIISKIIKPFTKKQTAVNKVTNNLLGKYFTVVSSRYISPVKIDLYKMFGLSTISPTQWREMTPLVVRTVSNIKSNPLFGRYLTDEMAHKFLTNMQIMSEANFPKKGGVAGFCRFGANMESKIVIKEQHLFARSSNFTSSVLAHETFHAMSNAFSKIQTRYSSLFDQDIEEGVTDYFASIYVKQTHGEVLGDGYPNQIKIVKALEQLFEKRYDPREYGQDVGVRVLAKRYFSADESWAPILNEYFGQGFSEGLKKAMYTPTGTNFNAGISYIRTYNIPSSLYQK